MGFSRKYIEHFTHPRGIGEVDPADATCQVEHAGEGCFDQIKMSIQVVDGKISDLKFRARACSGTIAACSAVTEIAIGMDVESAKSITPDDVANFLDGVPEKKRHSVELAVEALTTAIESLQV